MVKITGLEAFVNLVGKQNVLAHLEEEQDDSFEKEEDSEGDIGIDSGEVKRSPNYEPDEELDFEQQ